jgi:integrase
MLTDDITYYVDLHRELGFKFRLQECLLRHFARFAEPRGDEVVYSSTALAWAKEAPSSEQRRERLALVRRFARRMQVEDDRYELPPAQAFGRLTRRRRVPHVYSPDEIRRLLGAASRLGPSGTDRAETHVTLFALLASTGIRISEALALQLDDVTDDGLVIRNTKFRKSRLVPLHPTARDGVERYCALRIRRCVADTSLFLSLRDRGLSYSRANAIFLDLARSVGLRREPGAPGPCIHDLRHTFAVRALEAVDGDVEDIASHILALSTYLGHAHPSDTYWYLQATPKLMGGISRTTERFFIEANS